MILGVIADDFTGGTDIASFLVKEGMTTVQLIGVPTGDELIEQCKSSHAVVISLKSRSIPAPEAIEQSLQALDFLKRCGCSQVFFKYCSTFDSTRDGNIGPVAAALMQALETDFTVFSPALPVNGRSVFNSYLFVNGQLLSESPMKDHPLNPMRDSNVCRLVAMQSEGYGLKCGSITRNTVANETIDLCITQLKEQGYNCAVVDAIDDSDLYKQGRAFVDLALVTGGSGLGMGLARAHLERFSEIAACSGDVEHHLASGSAATSRGAPSDYKAIVLAGSCSAMTNAQVAAYKAKAPSFAVEVARCVQENSIDAYVDEILSGVLASNEALPPLVYATAKPEELKAIQAQYGAAASASIETFFFKLAVKLKEHGFQKFVVAGGETSGQVTKALAVQGFYIGPSIAPGVPWVRSINSDICLALKSGNFGQEDFFFTALEVR